MPTLRDELHRLIDELPEHDVHRLLEDLRRRDPLVNYPRSLREAPIDDEPETDEERAAVAEGLTALKRGEVVRDEELDRELGWR